LVLWALCVFPIYEFILYYLQRKEWQKNCKRIAKEWQKGLQKNGKKMKGEKDERGKKMKGGKR
jgi:hypothetical protein